MANNQYVNKVVYGDQTLIDLTSDTVSTNKLLNGYTAHGADGAPITGTIATKSVADIIHTWNTGERYLLFPSGYYPDSAMLLDNYIFIKVPSSGTNSLTVLIPNGTTTPNQSNNDDWIPLTIEVDSSGNSNVTDDTIPATGVSF